MLLLIIYICILYMCKSHFRYEQSTIEIACVTQASWKQYRLSIESISLYAGASKNLNFIKYDMSMLAITLIEFVCKVVERFASILS